MADLSGFTPQMAADPTLSAQVIHDLAVQRPDLHAALATNPSLSADMRSWLHKSPDPAVQQALAAFTATQSAVPPMDATIIRSTPVASVHPPVSSVPPAAPAPPSYPYVGATPLRPASATSTPISAGAPFLGTSIAREAPMPLGSMPQPAKKKPVALIAVTMVVAIGLVALGGYGALTYLPLRGGAVSPEKLSDRITAAVEDKNLLAFGGLIAPSELNSLSELEDVSKDLTPTVNPEVFQGHEALKEYMSKIHFNSSDMTWIQETKSDSLAILTLTSWNFNVTVDQSLASSLITRYEQAKGSALTDYETQGINDSVLAFSETINELDDRFTSSPSDVRVVTVKENGRWYISPLMTVLEFATKEMAESTGRLQNYTADLDSITGGAQPADTITNIANAMMTSTNAESYITDIARNLVAPERRALLVYGPVFLPTDSYEPAQGVSATWAPAATSMGDYTVVNMGTSVIDTPVGSLVFDGSKATWTSSGYSATIDFGRTLANPERLGFVVVEEDGRYLLSLTGSYANLLTLKPTQEALDKFLSSAHLGTDEQEAQQVRDFAAKSPQVFTVPIVYMDVLEQYMKMLFGGYGSSDSWGSGSSDSWGSTDSWGSSSSGSGSSGSSSSSGSSRSSWVLPAPAGAGSYALVDVPSKNISCELHTNYAACSILERNYAANGQRDCDSRLFSIQVGTGEATLSCGSEFLGSVGDPVHEMQYGETVVGPVGSEYACKSEPSGVLCWNQRTGEGFKIQEDKYAYTPYPGW